MKSESARDTIAEVNAAKMAAARALNTACDSATQVFGAEGLSELTPLSGIYRTARATRIMDGTDEALVSAVGRHILDRWREGRTFDFDAPSPDQRQEHHE